VAIVTNSTTWTGEVCGGRKPEACGEFEVLSLNSTVREYPTKFTVLSLAPNPALATPRYIREMASLAHTVSNNDLCTRGRAIAVWVCSARMIPNPPGTIDATNSQEPRPLGSWHLSNVVH
jgi:hypothetical protein